MEKDEILKLIKEEKEKDITAINQRIDQILLNFASDIKKQEPEPLVEAKPEPKNKVKFIF